MDAAAPVLMQPGDLLVFDSHLMHRSTDNTSDGIRAAMVFHCCVAGTRDVGASPTRNLVQDFVPLLRAGEVVPLEAGVVGPAGLEPATPAL